MNERVWNLKPKKKFETKITSTVQKSFFSKKHSRSWKKAADKLKRFNVVQKRAPFEKKTIEI